MEQQQQMTRGLCPDEMVHVLREEGLPVRTLPGWRRHNANSRGPWAPLHGVMLGHTGFPEVERSVTRARDAVGGPAAHGVIGPDGTVWLVASGRAQHAGQGSAEVLRGLRSGEVGGRLGMNTVDGDRHFYAFLGVHSGDARGRWGRAQVEAMVRVSSALCRAHGWVGPTPPVLGQSEWRRGGVGPSGMDMYEIRLRVWRRMSGIAPLRESA